MLSIKFASRYQALTIRTYYPGLRISNNNWDVKWSLLEISKHSLKLGEGGPYQEIMNKTMNFPWIWHKLLKTILSLKRLKLINFNQIQFEYFKELRI